jgi:predicted transcriptional regulator
MNKNFWIITVANPYCDLLLRGLKTMELRRLIPALQVGDVIFVCRAGGGTEIVGAFKVQGVNCFSVSYFCRDYVVEKHRVAPELVKSYGKGRPFLFGIILSRIRFRTPLKVEDFGYTGNPQYFYRVKVDFWHKIPSEIMEEVKNEEKKGGADVL